MKWTELYFEIEIISGIIATIIILLCCISHIICNIRYKRKLRKLRKDKNNENI